MTARIERRDGESVLLVGGRPFVMLAGEVHNSTSSSALAMERAWEKADVLCLNTVLAAISWELLEPEEGHFDFVEVDRLIEGARHHGKRLELLWFGSWKNGQCFYAPSWVKRNLDCFPRAEVERGVRQVRLPRMGDTTYSTLSAFGAKTREADARAFAALMAHVREVDAEAGTVIAVQVENECGLMTTARDHSAAADAAYAKDVPMALLDFMRAHADELVSDVRCALESGAESGSWEAVFGEGPVAEELFQAWHTARFVDAVAAAGKAEYDLPMFVNAWLDKGRVAGSYPTGGPVPRVHAVWKVAAPHVDVLGADIYVRDFCDVCDSFRTLGNPLSVPETVTHSYAAPRAIWVVGHHHALCYAPFGYEEMGKPFTAMQGFLFGMDVNDPALSTPQDPDVYAGAIRALADIVELAGEDGLARADAVISERGLVQELRLGSFALRASFDEGIPGALLALPVADDEAYLVAMGCQLMPLSADEDRPNIDVLALESGHIEDGAWVRDCRLNGDEAQIMRYDEPKLLRLQVLLWE